MKKKILISITCIIVLIIIALLLLPHITIRTENKIKIISYSDDISKYETNLCYDESYSYNEKWDVSIYEFDIKKVGMFYIITFEYEEGNVCDYEYYLEESYIKNVIENAEITYNSHNIDLEELIQDKEAIVSNTLYLNNDYTTMIEYKLNDKYEIMYIFYQDDLLVLQVGNRDEGAKFIAYK